MYSTQTDDSNHHYEEPQEKKGEEHIPKERNTKIFHKLIRNTSVINVPQGEEEYDDDEKYEPVDE